MSARSAAITSVSRRRRGFGIILDEGSFIEYDASLEPGDPLGFKDLKKYRERVKAAQKKSYGKDAFISSEGSINGLRVMLGIFDFCFYGRLNGLRRRREDNAPY